MMKDFPACGPLSFTPISKERGTQKGTQMVSKQKICSRQSLRRSTLFLLLSTSIILLSTLITLLWQQQNRQQTQADSPYVVGSPTLPAETVNSILAGTPMAGTGQVIEQASRNTNIDDAFALGVWWTETNDGAAGVGLSYRNPGGVRSSAGYAVGGGGYTIYPSYAAAINDWFNIVESRYINRGLTSVYTICYPYVGTSGAASWANKVFNLMARYHAMAPAPVPTPSPTPSPTPKPRDWQQEQPVATAYPKHVKQSAPVAAPAKQKSAPVSAVMSGLSAKNQNLVIGFGLLGSAMLAGLGVIARRQRTQVSVPPASPALPITTALAMDGFNELNMASLSGNNLSPVPNHYASSLVAPEFEPLEGVPEPATAPISTVPGGGLLTRYGGSAIAPRHMSLKTPAMQTEQLSSANQEESRTSQAFDSTYDHGPTTTAGLPSIRPGISLPTRGNDNEAILELMAAGRTPEEKRRGLLSRYRDNTP